MLKQYGTLFNYVCFEEDAVQQLGRADLKGKMMLIDSSIKDAKVIPEDDEYIYQHLPKVAARQQVSVNS